MSECINTEKKSQLEENTRPKSYLESLLFFFFFQNTGETGDVGNITDVMNRVVD